MTLDEAGGCVFDTRIAQQGFPIVIGNAGLGELREAGYVGTICIVTALDVDERAIGTTDIHVTREQLEQVRDRIVAYLRALDDGALS